MASAKQLQILLVEDNPGDVRLTEEALKESNDDHTLTVAEDGEAALAILRKEGEHAAAARPDLILLDLGLPKMNGREVLIQIKADPDLKRIPVVVLTLSSAEVDILNSYDLQVNNYVTKPLNAAEFKTVMQSVQTYLQAVARLQSR